jgi:gliding motility-associated-like protein
VIWQINLSQTAGYDDFPDDGWTLGNSFNQTQMYPDINISDNRIAVCYDECESDTIIEYITDTIVITEYENVYITDTLLITEYENVYIYDTITQYINLYDTLYIDNFIFDTTYVEVVVDNYIYVTDTITEYILQEIWIDCESGLECTDEPIGFDCESTTLYVPNTFTPNNDGVNDVWKIVYESTCWKQIDFTIYNRWGDVVFRGADDEFWDGSLNGGSYYVADGVYTYTLVGRREESLEYIQKSGMITVFR